MCQLSNLMMQRVGCASIGVTLSARTSGIPNDGAETMLASVHPAPLDLTIRLGEFEVFREKFSPSS